MLRLAVLAQLADLITFAGMLAVWGLGVEGNPVIRLGLSILPPDLEPLVVVVAVALKVALIGLIVYVARVATRLPRAAVLVTATAAGIYGAFFNFANIWVGIT